MSDATTLSFAKDIRPLFTDKDVDHMKRFGLDLSDHAHVKEKAEAILGTVTSGKMPPKGTGDPWTPQMCDTFKRWMEAGCPP